MYLQSSAGHISAQTPVIIPVYTYLGEEEVIQIEQENLKINQTGLNAIQDEQEKA